MYLPTSMNILEIKLTFGNFKNITEHVRKQRGKIVSPDEPRRETGVYWGYTVRIAHSISDIFTKSPYPGGYDLTVGTSDRGANVHEVPSKSLNFNHVLLVFGGLQGLESALSNDDKLQVDEPELLFDHYINVLPKQGSRTIRTEEAILIAMAAMQEKFNPKIDDIEEELIKDALPRSEDTGGLIPRPGETKMAKKRKRLEERQEKELEIQTPKKPELEPEQKAIEEPEVLIAAPTEPIIKKEKKSKKNPFKKLDDNAAVKLVNSDHANNDNDFEVVPVGKAEKKKSKSSISEDDLSRFD